MATRIEKPEVGKTYFGSDGRRRGVYWHDGWQCHAWRTSRSGDRLPVNGKLEDFDFYATDPTKPEPLPPLDLTKPVKLTDGARPYEVAFHMSDGTIRYRPRCNSQDIFVDRYGKHKDIRSLDLVQCVRRNWTATDVPWPWPVFRHKDQHDKMYALAAIVVNGITLLSYTINMHRRFDELASDWEYTVDGKTWQKCEAWE